MAHMEHYRAQMGGFDTTLAQRNEALVQNNVIEAMTHKKTGTTILGLKFNGGVILAADTKASAGHLNVELNCQKIHYVAPNIYCCGAGTAADTQFVNLFMSSNLELQRLNSNRTTRFNSYVTMTSRMLHKYEGNLSAYLIAAGYDALGCHLCFISAAGNYSYLPFASLGSGSLQALTILESKFKDNLTQDEAIAIAVQAITAGIFHDKGSGRNIDINVITPGKCDMRRNFMVHSDLKQPRFA